MAQNTRLALVLVCNNSQKLLKNAVGKILDILKKLEQENTISDLSYLCLADNGSKDDSWYEMGKLAAIYPRKVKALKLSSKINYNSAIAASIAEIRGFSGCDIVIASENENFSKEKIECIIKDFDSKKELFRVEDFSKKLFRQKFEYSIEQELL